MKMNEFITRLKQQPRLGQANTPRGAEPTSQPATQSQQSSQTIQEQVRQLAQQLANQIVAERDQAQILARNGRTYTKFDLVNDVVANQTEVVTAGLWSDNLASLTTYYTASGQTTSQRRYYVDVYQDTPSADGAAVQFALAFGHALGSGSNSQGQLNDSPSKAVYSQYRLDPGNWEIPLKPIASRATNATGSVVTGSGAIIQLIDDSSISSATVGQSGKVYNIVSGSINSGVYNSTAPVYYGLAYPDYGPLILDGKMLDQKLGFATNVSSSSEGNNHFVLFHSISGSAAFTDPATSDPYGFLARNSEKVTSTHYFVRIKNAEYNFSNNPSYVSGSVGQIAQSTFIGDPKTYITTVGLYNDNQELLAVAKLSKPLLKSFQREALIRVKLDF